jgi:hypothetical protein
MAIIIRGSDLLNNFLVEKSRCGNRNRAPLHIKNMGTLALATLPQKTLKVQLGEAIS